MTSSVPSLNACSSISGTGAMTMVCPVSRIPT